jgi:hypothetical protein
MLSRTKAILVGAAHTAELPQCRLAASDLYTQPRFLTRPQLLTRLSPLSPLPRGRDFSRSSPFLWTRVLEKPSVTGY